MPKGELTKGDVISSLNSLPPTYLIADIPANDRIV